MFDGTANQRGRNLASEITIVASPLDFLSKTCFHLLVSSQLANASVHQTITKLKAIKKMTITKTLLKVNQMKEEL